MAKKPTSITRSAISEISSGPCGALLRPHGFRRNAPNYWRSTEGIFQSVNFQASQWGSQKEGSFTVNLGVTSPTLYEAFTGRELPKNPATLLWPINRRIGGVMPNRTDLWWEVRAGTDVAALGNEVAAALEMFALPFLDRLRTPDLLNSALLTESSVTGLTDGQLSLVRATLAAQLGDEKAAVEILREALESYVGKPFESTVRHVAEVLGLPLHD